MPKLYYSPTSCGAASFISMVAAGLEFDVEQVHLDCHKTASDVDFFAINPKGNVPCLVLDDGTILNENVSVLQYIADMNPSSVAPAHGTVDRYLLVNTLGYLASEVQAVFLQLIHPAKHAESGDIKTELLKTLAQRFEYLEKHLLKGRSFLVGDKFSVADAYLYVMLHWDTKAGFELGLFPDLLSYRERIRELPTVVQAKETMERLVPTSG